MHPESENVLDVIKRRASVRTYEDRPLAEEVLAKILEAGVWGPSVPSFLAIQPWKFVVVLNKGKIAEVAETLSQRAAKAKVGVNILLNAAAKIIRGAPVVVFVYNSKDLENLREKYKHVYENFSAVIGGAQVSAIAAAVQNMILVAESCAVGSCWLDTPLFCQKDINSLLGRAGQDLFAVVTFGYPAQKGRRSQRKEIGEMREFIR